MIRRYSSAYAGPALIQELPMLKNNCLLISTLAYQLAAINLCCMADNPQVAFNVPVGQRQLFLDDMGIAQLDNLKRTMHQPDKKGAVIRCDPDRSGPDQYVIQIHTPPIWDPNERIWKCWTTTPGGGSKQFT